MPFLLGHFVPRINMPANIAARVRRQAYFLTLAEKNRERANCAFDPGLSNEYRRLAEGYEEIVRTLGEVNAYAALLADQPQTRRTLVSRQSTPS
jgi:hypothetical protein